MVSPDSSSNPNNIHQFLISNPTHYESQHFDAYGVDLRNLGSYPPQSLNVLPRSIDLIQPPHMTNEPQPNQHQIQKLSLSLGSSLLLPSTQYRDERCYISEQELQEKSRKYFNPTQYSPSLNQSSPFYGTDSFSMPLSSSRYLKPTQSLLEEIASLNGNDLDSTNKMYTAKLSGLGQFGSLRLCSELKAELSSNGFSMEKQELQATLVKLISLLEEVERRYEQYYQHLEEVVSSFELNAGLGSGKLYTALALNAMSGHFSSLKDAILAQICSTRKKILQDLHKINTGFAQLSLFDKETSRNNRVSLQHLGMMVSPRQTWRPIRGLPENSVMILRSWLFEHFLHPYPNDSEKLTLASQTGLSKNQVSNWFINARVRLWKPMIEEMYKEEFADSSEDSNL
ncbi:BEL1-like homeodomain protein 11 [Rutidosis leptorrhynchoides]|uniref:BEL1-like homeodomain protein 11 n=1 Tax=Rutidosis leptorrhynchoides TaxID=125765 RepID=UPI003A999F03